MSVERPSNRDHEIVLDTEPVGHGTSHPSSKVQTAREDGVVRRFFRWALGPTVVALATLAGFSFGLVVGWDDFLAEVTPERPTIEIEIASGETTMPRLPIDLEVTNLDPTYQVWVGIKDETGVWWVEQANDVGNLRDANGDIYRATIDAFDSASREGQEVVVTAMIVEPLAAQSLEVYWNLVTSVDGDYPDIWDLGYGRHLPVDGIVAQDSRLLTYEPSTNGR